MLSKDFYHDRYVKLQDILMEQEIAHKYNAYSTQRGNLIWVGTMSLAWKDLAKTYAESKPLEFQAENPKAIKTINNLNNSAFTEKEVDSGSIYVKTGKGSETQTQINKEVKEKFPNYSFPPLDLPLGPDDLISFAYLFKQLTFATKF